MLELVKRVERKSAALTTRHYSIQVRTATYLQFIDLTERVAQLVEDSGVCHGFINIQTRHTTTAVIVNEHEPLLLEDMKKLLERVAPREAEYQHNNFAIRTVNLDPQESRNGHSHCQALFLGTSVTLNVVDGRLQLGRWQRVFFIELDCAKERTVSVMILGEGE